MTSPNAFADDRWTLTWDLAALRDRRPRPSTWVADPLHRAMLLAIAVLATFVVWSLVTTVQDPAALTARDVCVMTAVDDAWAFTAVLGDDRPVPYAFAERACAGQTG